MTQSQKKLVKHHRTVFVDDSDDTDEELPNNHDRSMLNGVKSTGTQTTELKYILRKHNLKLVSPERTNSSVPPEAPSSSQKTPEPKKNGYRSQPESQESQTQSQTYRTGHFDATEEMEMVNYLINNHKISSCCSILTWQNMARDVSARQPQSLLQNFTKVIAPNIGEFLKTMGRIGEPRLLEKFRKALQQAQIKENPRSAALTASPTRTSSSSSSCSTVNGSSTDEQKQENSKKPKSAMSSASASLNGTVISDSEEETDTKDIREIIVPPLFNRCTRLFPERSSQAENKRNLPVFTDGIKKELKRSTDARLTPSIVTPEEEDDVTFFEAIDRSDKTDLVEGKLLIETSYESDAETVVLPSPIKRRSNENTCKIIISGERDCLNVLRIKRERTRSPSLPKNGSDNHPVRIKEEIREESISTSSTPEIPTRIKRELTDSQCITSVMNETRNIKQEEGNIQVKELMIKEDSMSSTSQFPQEPPTQSSKRMRFTQYEEPQPTTSAGFQGHGSLASEYNHILKPDNSDSDSDGEYIRTKRPTDTIVSVNKTVSFASRFNLIPCTVQLTPLDKVETWIRQQSKSQSAVLDEDVDPADSDDEETQFPPVRVTRSQVRKRKNAERAAKNTEKRVNDHHDDAHSRSAAGTSNRKQTSPQSAHSIEVIYIEDSDDDDDEETQFEQKNTGKMKKNNENKTDPVSSDSSSPILIRRRKKKRKFVDSDDDDDERNAEFYVNGNSPVSRRNRKKKTNNKNRGEKRRMNTEGDETDDVNDDDVPMLKSFRLWHEMYGPISVDRRYPRRKNQFDPNFHMNRPKPLPDQEFSEELLDALASDLRITSNRRIQSLIKDLAILHFYICRPRYISNCKGLGSASKLAALNWKVLNNTTAVALRDKVRNYIIGYIREFGLPDEILDEFIYWEWVRSIGEK